MIIHNKEVKTISFSLVTVLAVAVAFAFIMVLLYKQNLLNPGGVIFTVSIMAGIYYFIEFLWQLQFIAQAEKHSSDGEEDKCDLSITEGEEQQTGNLIEKGRI